MKLIDRIKFWLWHTQMSTWAKQHPLWDYLWTTRLETVYKPLFEKEGLRAVEEEHKRHVEKITKKHNAAESGKD